MPSLSDDVSRHVVIDRRPPAYICFPDVIRTADGRLVIAYNEADKHVRPTRRVLVVSSSFDNGRTWTKPQCLAERTSHCPRLLLRPDGTILLADSNRLFYTSADNGDSWEPLPTKGIAHDMLDRPLELGPDSFLTTGHRHVGNEEHPAIRQPPTEQIVYRSDDGAQTWQAVSTLAAHRNLVLCEASMTRLPDGRIAALMRENSFVFEPMYLCFSEDDGQSWSPPVETPIMGHRPTMGITSNGKILVTYRNVSPDWGTAAWLGDIEQLTAGYRVHGRACDPANPTFTQDGMRIKNGEGNTSVVRYALRPMTDPRTATADFEAEVRVDAAGKGGCGIRFGVWWRLYPDRIEPDGYDGPPIAMESGRFNMLRLEYAAGKVRLAVNGEHRAEITVDADHADTRPIMFGAPYPFEDNAVDCIWRRARLDIIEPAYDREHHWRWQASDGVPDRWVRENVLELRNDRHAAAPDFGYSGWTELDDGRFFCAYHHGGGNEEGYEPLHTSHIAGTWFTTDDFKKE